MKTAWIILLIIIIGLVGWGSYVYLPQKIKNLQGQKQTLLQLKTSHDMKITSSAFENNQNIPPKYTCNGANVNPPLAISGAPAGAQSLALIINDPDATIGTFTHWIVYNIDPKTTEIKENSVPEGAVQAVNDFSKANYGGPCPGAGTHRYFFNILALDIKLDLALGSNVKALEEKMAGHILDQGQLIGLYKKQ